MQWNIGSLFGGRRPEPDGRQKTGIPRLWELLDRDLTKFFLAGLPALLSATLYGFGVWCGLMSGSMLLTLVVGLAAGAITGPNLTGIMDIILRALRDEPGFRWEIYRRAWKQNALQSAAAAAILGAVLAGQIFSLYFVSNPLLAFFSMALLAAVFLYVFPQIALVKLGLMDIFRNALFLAVTNPAVTLRAVLTVAAWGFLLWILLPMSGFVWAAGGIWFPALLVLMGMNPLLTETFLNREE